MNNNISNQLNIENLLQTKWAEQFDEKQLDQIKKGLESNVDVTIYANPKFNWEQMFEILLGLEEDLDVSVYANPELNWKQMREIFYGLSERLDVTIYADPKFTASQMAEIRWGLEDNIKNINELLDVNLSPLEMERIRRNNR